MKKPTGRFTVYELNRTKGAYKSIHFRFTKSAGEQIERIFTPRQFMRSFESKRNLDWFVLLGNICYVLDNAVILHATASIRIYLGVGHVEQIGASIPRL